MSSKTDGFTAHGIDHGSNSMAGDFIDAPDYFVARRLKKIPFAMGVAVDSGTAIEAGVEKILVDKCSIDEGVAEALKVYDALVALKMSDPNLTKRRESIATSVALAADALAGYGDLELPENGRQHKIKVMMVDWKTDECVTENWRLPIIGYLDFKFPHAPKGKTVVDLKTTFRMPSKMSFGHQRQRAIYATANPGWRVEFLYVTPKKSQFLEDGDVAEIMAATKEHFRRLERFLSAGDADYLASIVPVNPDNWKWSSATARQVCRELYGV